MKWALVVLVACQTPSSPARNETGSATPPGSGADAKQNLPEEAIADARVEVDQPDPKPDPGKQLYDLGAVPAWQAVVDRNLYLERRTQHGVVYGTVGEPIVVKEPGSGDAGMTEVVTPYTWLIDDTEGNGALAIRVAFTVKPKPGDRIAVAGAWALDAEHRWFWKPTLVTALAPAPPSKAKDPAVAPGQAIGAGELAGGARPISLVKEGDAAYFTVLGTPPLADGDGWQVADELGNPVYALLNMPGERASFGAQDLRTADERWTLKRGQTYWVRIGPVHKHGPDKPVTLTARTAPVRVK
ncbi:MAG: hypothetical protein ABI678_21025 [Kofleriaceae bacterium]